MVRILLNNYIKQLAQSMQYAWYTGFVHRAGTVAEWFPALWMTPLKLVGVEGRQERRISYKVEFYLMRLNERYTEHAKEKVWARMEKEAVEIYTQLALQNNVIALRNLRCSPNETAYTGAGELSLQVEFEIELFDNECINPEI